MSLIINNGNEGGGGSSGGGSEVFPYIIDAGFKDYLGNDLLDAGKPVTMPSCTCSLSGIENDGNKIGRALHFVGTYSASYPMIGLSVLFGSDGEFMGVTRSGTQNTHVSTTYPNNFSLSHGGYLEMIMPTDGVLIRGVQSMVSDTNIFSYHILLRSNGYVKTDNTASVLSTTGFYSKMGYVKSSGTTKGVTSSLFTHNGKVYTIVLLCNPSYEDFKLGIVECNYSSGSLTFGSVKSSISFRHRERPTGVTISDISLNQITNGFVADANNKNKIYTLANLSWNYSSGGSSGGKSARLGIECNLADFTLSVIDFPAGDNTMYYNYKYVASLFENGAWTEDNIFYIITYSTSDKNTVNYLRKQQYSTSFSDVSDNIVIADGRTLNDYRVQAGKGYVLSVPVNVGNGDDLIINNGQQIITFMTGVGSISGASGTYCWAVPKFIIQKPDFKKAFYKKITHV